MRDININRGKEPTDDDCTGNGCPEIGTNGGPLADMGILMSNEEDCQGSVDFWMARVKYSLRRNDKIP